ncbi:ribonuclease HII [Halegenticoccus tardaugens]|uniref:ribonuclease HII n=1 Tax=Halegenticoccus tardaugens TaxID=2071624 RepID=UPI00100ACF9A|nr:ribonuclease HII [Halegenticoccus tardaugens]
MERVGADEAGRGPVLGPMVAAAVRAEPSALPADVDDSKRIAPPRREAIAAELRAADGVSIGVAVVGVARIDDPETNMNALTVAAQAEAVAAVADDGDAVVVDACDVDPARFGRRVRAGVGEAGTEIEVAAEHGADERHALVGAASVVAKVERDARIEALAAEYGSVGSGYPSDPTTREFLREYVRERGRLPACARSSWRTCSDLLAAAEQSALSEF